MMLYQQGEYGAFRELYLRHSGRVYGYLKKKMFQPGEAEDVLQQVFLKFHQYRGNYDPALPLLPWLFSIVRNTHIDQLRKRRPIPLESEKLAALAERAEQADAVGEKTVTWDEVLSLLPEDQRRLIQQRFDEGLSFEEIAQMSGITEISARKRVSRTIQSLRKLLFKSQNKGARS